MRKQLVPMVGGGSVLAVVLTAGMVVPGPAAPPVGAQIAANGLAIYTVDSSKTPGVITSVDPDTGGMLGVYTRAAGPIVSFGMNEYPERILFSSGRDPNLYEVRSSQGRWEPEQVLYTHTALICDIEQVLRPGLPHDIYFSDTSGSGRPATGMIYQLAFGEAFPYYEVSFADLGGHWDGRFTIRGDGRLYLSTGLTAPGSMYMVVDGVPQPVLQVQSEPIGGLSWVPGVGNEGAIYYTNLEQELYRLDLTQGCRSLLFTNPSAGRLADVDTTGLESSPPEPLPTNTSEVTETATATGIAQSTPTSTPSPKPTLTPSATVTGPPPQTELTVVVETVSGVQLTGARVLLDIDGVREIVASPVSRQVLRSSVVTVAAATRISRDPLFLELVRWRIEGSGTSTSNPLRVELNQPVVRLVAVYRRAEATATPGTAIPTGSVTATSTDAATATSTATGSAPPQVTGTATRTPAASISPEATSTPTETDILPEFRIYIPIADQHLDRG